MRVIVLGGLVLAAGLVVLFGSNDRGTLDLGILDLGTLDLGKLGWALIAAGAGIVIAGVVARLRRRAKGVAGTPVQRVRAVPRMVRDSWRGRYAGLPRYQTMLWLLGLIYLIWPIDLIPEFLALVGVADDVGIAGWLAASMYAEAGTYLASGRRAADTRPGPPSS